MDRLGRDVERTLSSLGAPALGLLADVVAAWPAVAGDAIARSAWPRRIGRDGTLHVATASSVWAFELDRMAPLLQARLSEALGARAPARLRFAPGPLPEPASAPVRPAPSPSPAPARPPAGADGPSAQAARAVAVIDDPELRSLAERAAAAHLARTAAERG